MKLSPLAAHRLHARSDGSGPAVLCLHSSAGSSQQWQALADQLAPGFRVTRVDSLGHGRSAAPDAGVPVFAQDAAALGAHVAACADGVHLVGHSYGAALAIRLALAHPQRVRSLVLYEPVLFSLLDDRRFDPSLREEVLQVGRRIGALSAARQVLRAARCFIDYWAGPGAWLALGARQQQAIARRVPVVAAHFGSISSEPISLRRLAALGVPALLLSGARSRRVTHAIADALAHEWPHAERFRFPGLGHLGPITHAARVNRFIAGFLGSLDLRATTAERLPEVSAAVQ